MEAYETSSLLLADPAILKCPSWDFNPFKVDGKTFLLSPIAYNYYKVFNYKDGRSFED